MNKLLPALFFQRRNKNTMSKLVSGFTLIEALVAISILMIAIASPMTLAQKSLSTATFSKDQMIASFLAQDAIEAVKNIRDQIAVSAPDGDWLDRGDAGLSLRVCICNNTDKICNFDSVTSQPSYCIIDTTSSIWNEESIKSGSLNNGPLIIYSLNSIFTRYGYLNPNNESFVNSKFTRYINIKKSANPDEAVVNVRVSWDSAQGLRLQKIDIQDFLYNYSSNLTNI